MVAFYKLSGLSRIFPKSKTFNKYYLGHLDIDEINEVEILSGAFIKVIKGQSDVNATRFSLKTVAPVETANKRGLRVIVTGTKLSSLKVGSPIFYRQIKIGSVEAFALSHDAKGVDLKLFIDECYSYLVRENSIFYNATAMGMDVSLFGVKISTETISTMINGGITMVTPDDANSKAQELEHYKLYSKCLIYQLEPSLHWK
jgi:paraquat-inducible protein B